MKLQLLSLLFGLSQAASGTFDYKLNGADWKDVKYEDGTVNECGSGKNQSPIDLTRKVDKVEPAQQDLFGRIYSNVKNEEVKWTKFTSQIDFNDDFGGFKSRHNYETRLTVDRWEAAQLHWHASSEHTIDGKQFGLELHIVHKKKNQRPDGK